MLKAVPVVMTLTVWASAAQARYTETMDPNGPAKNLKTDYGLVDDNAATNQSEVFQEAIDELAEAGGGRLMVPKGTYQLARIRLRSNIHLLIEAGTVIKPYWPEGTKAVVFLMDAERPEKKKTWTEEDEMAYIENVSIRGVGGPFIIDYSDRERVEGEGIRAVLTKMVKNFLIENLDVRDNYTVYCGITLTEQQTKHDSSKWPVSRSTDGTIRNCRIFNASPGYGLTQLHGAQSCHFENIYADGGVTLRLETGCGPCYDITANNVTNANGRCAVMFGPHSAMNGLVQVENVKSIGSTYAVTIGKGGVKQSELARNPDATDGIFAEGSYVKNITAVFGKTAQIKTHAILSVPEEYYDDLDLVWIDKFFRGPSIGGVKDTTGGHYTIRIENVKLEGFTHNADKAILTEKDARPGKWPHELRKWKAERERPNVLMIAVDDLNTCPEGFGGETTVATPNISRLAEKGVRFTNAHCAAPSCNPSRAAVMTGVAPATSGVYINPQDWRENRMLKDWATLPHHFRANGYTTMGGGKLYHASSLSRGAYTGFLDPRPWDEYFPSRQRQMPEEVKPESVPMNTYKDFYGGRFDWAELDIDADEMADAKVVAWATEQLGKKHDKPLFLAVGIYRPHIPWWTPKGYFDRHPVDRVERPGIQENDLDDIPDAGKARLKTRWHRWLVENGKWDAAIRGYNASVSFADDMIGRLLDALENGPLSDDTIVVLWSDHGYHLGQKEHWEKFALWEQTTRVPFVISAPGVSTAGAACGQPVSLLDIYPTLTELCGFKPLKELDGRSLVPLLKEPKTKTGRAVVMTHGYRNHAIRTVRWRYIRYADGSEELYDQERDPRNFTNLAGSPECVAVKRQLALCLPKKDAEKDPAANAQVRWRKREAN